MAYDFWNFAYTYNCISDHSFYCGLALLISCTVPAFFIKRGAWLQHRAHTLALRIMFVMTVPQFADRLAPVFTTHNLTMFFIVSLVSLVANAAVAICSSSRSAAASSTRSRTRSTPTRSPTRRSWQRTSSV